jgi:hypothetical protein
MPKWAKDAKEFTVSVLYHEIKGYQSTIPKPIIEHLGKGKKVERITYQIKGSRVEIRMTEVNSETKKAEMTKS